MSISHPICFPFFFFFFGGVLPFRLSVYYEHLLYVDFVSIVGSKQDFVKLSDRFPESIEYGVAASDIKSHATAKDRSIID